MWRSGERNPGRKNSNHKCPETETSPVCPTNRFQCARSNTTNGMVAFIGGLRGMQELDHRGPLKPRQNSFNSKEI